MDANVLSPSLPAASRSRVRATIQNFRPRCLLCQRHGPGDYLSCNLAGEARQGVVGHSEPRLARRSPQRRAWDGSCRWGDDHTPFSEWSPQYRFRTRTKSNFRHCPQPERLSGKEHAGAGAGGCSSTSRTKARHFLRCWKTECTSGFLILKLSHCGETQAEHLRSARTGDCHRPLSDGPCISCLPVQLSRHCPGNFASTHAPVIGTNPRHLATIASTRPLTDMGPPSSSLLPCVPSDAVRNSSSSDPEFGA